jgi:HEAT repeat protein
MDAEMRYEAARACGALQIAGAVARLSRMTADTDAEVKLAAVEALGLIGGPEARRVLEICAEMGDAALQDAAHAALEEVEYMEGEIDLALYDLDLQEEDDEDAFDREELGDWADGDLYT